MLSPRGPAPLAGVRNFLYAQLQRHSVAFGLGVGLVATVLGVFGGLVPELLLVVGMLGWLAWEARPNLYFALGLYPSSAAAAALLARGAGPSLRGDVHRLTQAAALLTLGDVQEAKAALAEIDPDRLPPRGRFVHFLNLSALFCRLGDGEGALAMVEASKAEAEDIQPAWKGLPEINRSAALCEMGRFDEAAACLEEVGEKRLPSAALPYFCNNLAWSLALGTGDAQVALGLARRAAGMRGRDPGCQGTLGVALLLSGSEPLPALARLRPALDQLERRSPHGRGVLLAAAAYAYRQLGDDATASSVAERLQEMPTREASQTAFDTARARRGLPA